MEIAQRKDVAGLKEEFFHIPGTYLKDDPALIRENTSLTVKVMTEKGS